MSDFQSDLDVGGTEVNSVAIDLSLSSSRMDTVIDPNSLVAYTEWTLTFANSARSDREARTEIALPPGGVVSRLTLWVNGEEREAAFSTRGKVRAAYQEVAVVQQRDPVLVTSCGIDRVLVQCFPVPSAGTMKVRLGITSPLVPEDYSRGVLVLPHFAERNFAVPDGLTHSLFARSPQHIGLGNSNVSSRPDGSLAVSLSDSDLAGARSSLICSRNPSVRTVWSPDRQRRGSGIMQTIVESSTASPKSIIIVVDGSRRMQSCLPKIAASLDKYPLYGPISLIAAIDSNSRPSRRTRGDSRESVIDDIRAINCVGGIDNRQALIQALDASTRIDSQPTAIVWIHGPQPLKSDALTDQLLQRVQNRGTTPIYSIAAVEGTNTILADLEKTGIVTVVPRRGSVSDDLSRVFDSWKNPPLATYRRRIGVAAATGSVRGSSHVCRLWARDEVARVCSAGDSRAFAKASEMAAAYQLVTPLSGAVVLETEQQYKDAGLRPVDPKTTPAAVPEPAGLVTLAAGAVPLWRMLRRRRQARNQQERDCPQETKC